MKCADAYIFRRKYVDCTPGNAGSFVSITTVYRIESMCLWTEEVSEYVHRIFHSAIVYFLGCRNLRRHSQLQTRWTHIFFFSLSFHFFFFSSRLLCLVVSLSASSCASKGISYHVSVSRLALSATKRMAGKSLKCADVYKLRSKWKLYRWQWPMISKASPPAFSFLNLHCT